MTVLQNTSRIEKIFTKLQAKNPNPRTELNYINDFTLLIAVVLSAQATDKGVNKATEKLFLVASSPQEIIELGEENLKEFIKSIGLYKNKAKNIILLSNKIIKDFNNHIPKTREELESLPGVGRKTANIILNIVFKQDVIAVDTHVLRVSNRLGLATHQKPLNVEEQLMVNIPNSFRKHAHHWLVLHGRYICKAKKPLCQICILNELCSAKKDFIAT